ncbi:MAG: hypothetical protein LBV60_12845 [Streptomyces sp.]|nr:hypothetical protein [Streptomyces sp.]
MPCRSSVRTHTLRSFPLPLVALACTLTAVVLTGCTHGGRSPSAPKTPTTPNTAAFSGTPPSVLASSASAAIASARASASAAASSASARASEFEASVNASAVRSAAAAEKELKHVHGGGNARSEVSLKGLPKSQTGGLLAALVTITNKSDRKASYAVQVDFVNAEGHAVETRFAGAENLAPGKTEQPIAFSRRPAEPGLKPRLTKAQRY